MIYRTIAFPHALRHMLRNTNASAELKLLLEQNEWQQTSKTDNIPDYLMHQMGKDLRLCMDEKRLDGCLAVAIDRTMSAMTSAAASCERIKSTPIPFSYTLMLHRTYGKLASSSGNTASCVARVGRLGIGGNDAAVCSPIQ